MRGFRWLIALALLVAIGGEAFLLFRWTASSRSEGDDAYVQAIDVGSRVGQTFRAPGNGLAAVDVQFSSEASVTVMLICRLMGWAPYALTDGSGQWASIYTWTERLELRPGRRWHRFAFRPVMDSETKVYQFQLEPQAFARSDGPHDPAGVAVVASRADSLRDGNLIVDREQVTDKDLVIATYTASLFAQTQLRVNSRLPRALRSTPVQLALLALYNLALATFVYQLTVRSGES